MKKILQFVFLLASSFSLLAPLSAQTDGPATLPQAFVKDATLTTQATFPNTAGYITKTVCASGCDYTVIQNGTTGALDKIHTDGGDVSGEIVKLQNTTWTGQFVLPTYTMSAGKYVIITTNTAASNLPPVGTRTGPSYSGQMAIINTTASSGGAFSTAVTANGYWLWGLELETTTNNQTGGIFVCGGSSETTAASISNNIILDRVYIHGVAGNNIQRGVAGNCNSFAIYNSYISEIHYVGQEAQAVLIWNSNGPIDIRNNEMSASGQSVMFGAADPYVVGQNAIIAADNATCSSAGACQIDASHVQYTCTTTCGSNFTAGNNVSVSGVASPFFAFYGPITSSTATTFTVAYAPTTVGTHGTLVTAAQNSANVGGAIPSDIIVSQNYMFKPFTWDILDRNYGGIHYGTKNDFEIKSAQRMLMEGNMTEDVWADLQVGTCYMFTPRNPSGNNPEGTLSNITVRYNYCRHATEGMRIAGADCSTCGGTGPSQPSQFLSIHDNYFYDINANQYGPGNATYAYTFTWPTLVALPHDITINHDTVVAVCLSGASAFTCSGGMNFADNGNNGQKMVNFTVKNSILMAGGNGTLHCSVGNGTTCLTDFVTNSNWNNNVMVGETCSNYPTAANNCPAHPSNVGFNDFDRGQHWLAPTSAYITAADDGTQIGANVILTRSKLNNGDSTNADGTTSSSGAVLNGGTKQ